MKSGAHKIFGRLSVIAQITFPNLVPVFFADEGDVIAKVNISW